MTKPVRLWGGPACGEVKHVPDYCEKVRIHIPEPLDIAAMMRPDYQMPRSVNTTEFEYIPGNFQDSRGIEVYIPDNIPLWRCIAENFDRMAAEFYMNHARPAKACIVPHPVWNEFEREYCGSQSMICTPNMRSVDGTITFKGIRIIYGDEFKMLQNVPEPRQYRFPEYQFGPTPTRGDIDDAMSERDPEEIRRQYEGEWPMGMPQIRGVDEGRPNAALAMRGYRTGSPAHRTAMAQIDRPSSSPLIQTNRRNRTTVYSGGVRCLFRIVFENGPKLNEERKAKLHTQYLQALKNNHMQYLENSDLI